MEAVQVKKSDLNVTKVSYLFGINEYMPQQNAVDLALVKSPKFKIVYETYQEVLAAVHTKYSVKINDLINHYQYTYGNGYRSQMASLKE